MLAQETVLKVNACFSDEIIGRDTVPVHDGDSEGVVKGKESWEFKHLAKDRVELTGDVVLLVVDHLLSNLHLQEWIRLQGRKWGCEGAGGRGRADDGVTG